ncbi:hypothetical protein MIMGU_mgv1a022967mg, partial [Erythranthe guttata]
FYRLSRVEPWDLMTDLKSHLKTLYAQSFRITLASSILPQLFLQTSGKSMKKRGSNGTIPPSPQNEGGDLVVLGL